jgi:hypothetical protein
MTWFVLPDRPTHLRARHYAMREIERAVVEATHPPYRPVRLLALWLFWLAWERATRLVRRAPRHRSEAEVCEYDTATASVRRAA